MFKRFLLRFISFVFVLSGVAITERAFAAPVPTSGCFEFADYLDIGMDGGKSCNPGGDLSFNVDFPYGMMYGTGICSSTSAKEQFVLDTPSANSGNFCWCSLTGYDNGKDISFVGSSKYAIFIDKMPDDCENYCGCLCADMLGGDKTARGALYGDGDKVDNKFCIGSGNDCTTLQTLDPNFCDLELSEYDVTSATEWYARFGGGNVLEGEARCTDQNAANYGDIGTPGSTNGRSCWCRATDYHDGTNTYTATSSDWFYIEEMNTDGDCTHNCAKSCPLALAKKFWCDVGAGQFCIDSGNGCTTLQTLNPNFCNLELRGGGANSDTTWHSNFGTGDALRGESKCTDQHAANYGDIGTPGSTNGQYCWCRATDYHDGTNTYTATSSDWFYAKAMGSYGNCTNDCSALCGKDFIKNFLCDLGAGQFCIGDSSYHVTYSCNGAGGTAPTDSHDYNDGDQVITESNTCKTSPDQVFLGWMCDGALVPAGGTFTINDNTTCNAMYSNSTFSVGTTDMDSGSSIQFSLSAQGTFYVNCGTGGTLSGPSGSGVVGNTITKNDTTAYTYTCTYSSAGPKTIGFAGTATGYNPTNTGWWAYVPPISFADNTAVVSLNGNLSVMFPVLGSSMGQFPIYYSAFANCTSLTTISSTLFANYTGNLSNQFYMFEHAFDSCTSLQTIPAGLFTGITAASLAMFSGTFEGCSSLTTIPSNLFAGITAGNAHAFASTFSSCTSLQTIPSGLFTNITSGGDSMFRNTFSGCTGLTSIPSDLFAGITTGATEMFHDTFYGCANLTAIPSGLFTNVTTGAQAMFMGTFSGCTGLTSIPSGLFASITTAADIMFKSAFYGCTGLTGYIPPDLFAGLTPKQASYPANMMDYTFTGCTNLATSCTGGTAQYTTGYESDWDGHVSCSTAYTVSYACDAHGSGSPTDSNSPYLPNATVTTLASSACTAATGYNFNGWNCGNTVNNGNNITAGNTFSMPAANVTCTAQWTPKTTTITYSCGTGSVISGQSGNMSQTFTYGEQYSMTQASNLCQRPGYIVYPGSGNVGSHNAYGWICYNNTTPVNTFGEETGQAWNHTWANLTCTPQWLARNYTVTYNCNGGSAVSGATMSASFQYDSSYSLASVSDKCSRLGYDPATSGSHNVGGWVCTVENQANTYLSAASGTWTSTNDYTCRAQWRTHTTGVTFNCDNNVNNPTTSTTSYTYNSSYNIANNAPSCSRPGYRRVTSGNNIIANGWRCSLGSGYLNAVSGTWTSMENTMTCTATWEPDFVGYDCGAHGTAGISHTDLLTMGAPYTFRTYANSGCTVENGYTFSNWSCSSLPGSTQTVNQTWNANYTVNSWNYDACLQCTAQYTGNTYTITYAPGSAGFGVLPTGTTASTTATYGASATLATNGYTAPRGYVFSSWRCRDAGGNVDIQYGSGQTVDSWPHAYDLTCTAQWGQNFTNYTITYSCGDGTGTPPANGSARFNTSFTTAANTCSRTGYTFAGWLVSGSNDIKPAETTLTWTYTGNRTLTAQWTPKTYRVTYNCAGGSAVTVSIGGGLQTQVPLFQDMTYGDSYTLPMVADKCTRTGYNPSSSHTNGWVCSATSALVNSPSASGTWTYASDYTCTAQWNAINYTVSFEGGSTVTGATPTGFTSSLTNKHYQDTVTLPSSTFDAPEGFTFDKWSCNNSIGNKNAGATFSMPAANVTCTAQWKYVDYTIDFAPGDCTGTMSSQSNNHYGDTITLPANGFTVPTGRQFDGWNCDNSIGDKAVAATFSMPAANVTCTAQCPQIDYTVSFNKGDGSGTMDSQTGKHYGDTITLPQSSFGVPTGYHFNGWNCGATVNDGDVLNAGATFSMPAANVTCTAQYKYINYTIDFAPGDCTGTMSSQPNNHYGDTITLPANGFTVPTGRQFDGWKCGASVSNNATLAAAATFSMPAADITCTAQCPQIDYTVSFNKGEGSGTMSSQTGKHYGDTITLPQSSFGVPTGYHFNGWNCGATVNDGDVLNAGATFSMPAANVTCTAQWTQTNYSITYYDSDCTTVLSGLSPSSYIITDGTVTLPDSTAVEAANITKTGYHFVGWKDINNPSQSGYIPAIFASTATDRAFCAAWGGNRYRVAYGHGTNGSGSGSFSNDATYGQNYLIRGLGTDKSVNGARQSGVTANAGYAFASWSGSDGNTYAETATITPYQIDGQLTLTAQWTAIDYTVSFEAGSAGGSTPTGSTTSQTGKHIGNTITLPSSGFSAPTGWQFDGWNCGASINNGNNLAASATFTMPAANVTCTAQWTQTNYTVSFVAGSAGGSTPSGSVSSLTNKHYGDTITLPSSGFTAPSWYFFTGWSCNNSIGNKAVGATFSMPAANVTCTAQWVQNKFSITTTNMTASSTFQFTMTATGTFIVDCGAGGVLTGSGVTNGNTITRSGTTSTTYTCTYSTAGTKVIKFGGAATGYNTNETASPVGFNTSKTKIASVSGNFYLLFPDLGASSGQKPRFYQTFYQCTNLTSIPANLFDGYTTGPSKMFYSTFAGCTSLASIPAGLFSTVTTGSSHMFGHTFSGCTLLKSIPADLFENLATAADSLFYYTFYNCTSLGTDSSIVNPVPAALFSSLTNNLSNATYLFDSTFEGCSGLTSVPAGLFSNINTSAEGMFRRTFKASGLTSIPTTLFSNVTTGATYLFGETFYNCTGLTALPQDLFANVATPASQLFSSTFQGCTNLTGYIPPTLFGGLIPRQSTYPSNMMSGVFQSDSQLLTTCPNGTIDFVTGYESNGWSNKKSCQPGSNITYACGSGSGTRPANTSVVYNTSFTPAANTCTAPSGYSFSGWLVSDTSDIKQPGTAFTWTYTEHKTLTAQWTAINYTVSFAEGDGSGTMDSQTGKHYGDTITLPSSTFTAPTGYHFDKWSCNPSVGNKAAGATFSMPTADVTCTAQYVANTLDLTWYKEDGTTVVSNTPDCTYGQTFTGLPTPPEKTGYHFKKWNVVQ